MSSTSERLAHDHEDAERDASSMTATELARNLSAVLDRVADGETVEVTRGGRRIAEILPTKREWISGAEFLKVLQQSPSFDPDFAKDLERIRAENDARPERATPLQWD